jgi:hypothetical protein
MAEVEEQDREFIREREAANGLVSNFATGDAIARSGLLEFSLDECQAVEANSNSFLRSPCHPSGVAQKHVFLGSATISDLGT